jgi:hypothetical protein
MRISVEYLRYHWGDAYVITRENGIWTATARFGDRTVLTAECGEKLRRLIWNHYPGLFADRSST